METSADRRRRKLNALIEAEGGLKPQRPNQPGHYKIAERVSTHEGKGADHRNMAQTLSQYATGWNGKKVGDLTARRIEAAYEAARLYGIKHGWFDSEEENWQTRDLLTTYQTSLPHAGGQRHAVNEAPKTYASGPIWELPLLPSDRLDLMQRPNSDLEIERLPKVKVTPSQIWRQDSDKAVIMPDHSFGQRPAMGDVLIFRPIPPGQPVPATKTPILVKLPDGTHAVMAFNTLQISLNNLQVVAVCKHWHPPIEDE